MPQSNFELQVHSWINRTFNATHNFSLSVSPPRFSHCRPHTLSVQWIYVWHITLVHSDGSWCRQNILILPDHGWIPSPRVRNSPVVSFSPSCSILNIFICIWRCVSAYRTLIHNLNLVLSRRISCTFCVPSVCHLKARFFRFAFCLWPMQSLQSLCCLLDPSSSWVNYPNWHLDYFRSREAWTMRTGPPTPGH